MRTRLTKSVVERVAASTKDVIVWDSEVNGFGLKVTPNGRRAYFVFYRTLSGQQRKPSIGVHGKITTDQARQIAKRWIAAALTGNDVSADRQEAKVAPLVRELAALYLEDYAKPFKKPRGVTSDRSNLENHVLPLIGAKKVTEITRADIEFVKPSIREGKTAARRGPSIGDAASSQAVPVLRTALSRSTVRLAMFCAVIRHQRAGVLSSRAQQGRGGRPLASHGGASSGELTSTTPPTSIACATLSHHGRSWVDSRSRRPECCLATSRPKRRCDTPIILRRPLGITVK
jgi:hypothetical protein